MKIIFEEGRDNGYLEYFAISQMGVYKGRLYEELMWAEIRWWDKNDIGTGQQYSVQWEDDWTTKHWFKTLEEAKIYVLQNWSNHKPHINGRSFDLN